MMIVSMVETKWRAAGLILIGLLAPGGGLIVLSALLGKRMWSGRLTEQVAREEESRVEEDVSG